MRAALSAIVQWFRDTWNLPWRLKGAFLGVLALVVALAVTLTVVIATGGGEDLTAVSGVVQAPTQTATAAPTATPSPAPTPSPIPSPAPTSAPAPVAPQSPPTPLAIPQPVVVPPAQQPTPPPPPPPPPPLAPPASGQTLAEQAIVEQFNACAEVWNSGALVEFSLDIASGDNPYKQREFEILQEYLESNCLGIGARLASVQGSEEWCLLMLSVASLVASSIELSDSEHYFNSFEKTEIDSFLVATGC